MRFFVCRFLSEYRIKRFLALVAVAHLNLNFLKEIQIGGKDYGLQQSQRRKEMAALERSVRGKVILQPQGKEFFT